MANIKKVGSHLKKSVKGFGKAMYQAGMYSGKVSMQAYGINQNWDKERDLVRTIASKIRKK